MQKRKNISLGFAAIVSVIPLIGVLAAKKQSASLVNARVNNTVGKIMPILFIKDTTVIPDSIYHKIFLQLKNIIIEKLGVDSSDVKPDAHITKDLGADSLDVVELIMEVEKFYDISIPDEEAEKVNTVNDFVLLVYKIKGNKK